MRRRRRQADLWPRVALRRDRVRVFARSPGAVRAHRRGRGGAAGGDGGRRRARRDQHPGAGRAYRAAARAGGEAGAAQGPAPGRPRRVLPARHGRGGRGRGARGDRRASRAGARIVKVSLPNTKYAIATYYLVCTAEASSNLARYDGVRTDIARRTRARWRRCTRETRGEGFGAEPKRPDHAGRVRAARRLLRGVLRQGAARAAQIADDFTARSPPATRSSRRPRPCRRSSSASARAIRCRCISPTC